MMVEKSKFYLNQQMTVPTTESQPITMQPELLAQRRTALLNYLVLPLPLVCIAQVLK
jgi:hypothetical protein